MNLYVASKKKPRAREREREIVNLHFGPIWGKGKEVNNNTKDHFGARERELEREREREIEIEIGREQAQKKK